MITGYTTGVYDLFHIGHLNLLKNAKGLCDKLIVGVTVDELVKYKNKRAIIPFEDRIEIVRSIKYVDVAIPQTNIDKFAAWEKLKFDILFVGDDWYKSDSWQEMEAKFKNVGVKIVEPISGNSNDGIRFLHPECRLYRSRATVKGFTGNHRIVGTPINNSSVVIMLAFGGRSMVFTGDLEQKGFAKMSGAGTCSSYLFDANYYIVSHHGSINGHPTMACGSQKWHGATPLTCSTNGTLRAILMGRDGAYSGIYSTVVTGYWCSVPNRLVKTETAQHYMELEWGTNIVRYI